MAGLPQSCLQEVITSLLDSLNEKDDVLQKEVTNIFLTISVNHSSVVIEKILEYVESHKMSSSHKSSVLFEFDCICQSASLVAVDEQLLRKVVIKMSYEMVSKDENLAPFQKSASGILVSVGCINAHLVMDNLFTVFQPGIVPHIYTVRTLGLLAWKNVFGMIPFLKAVLGTSLSMLPIVKKDNIKWAFCEAYVHFCNAISEYVENLDKAPDKSVTKSCFTVEMDVSYDIMLTWLNCKDANLQLQVVDALCHIFSLLTAEKLFDNSGKLIGVIVGLLKKQSDCHVLSNALAVLLSTISQFHPEIVGQEFDLLAHVLFNQLSHPVDYTNPKSVKNHAEILRCFDFLVRQDSGAVINFAAGKLNSNHERSKIGSLLLIKHILNSSQDEIKPFVNVLLKCLHDHVDENNNRVRRCICQVIASLAQHDLLDSEENFCFIEFVIKLCAMQSDDDENSKNSNMEDVSNSALQTMGTRILYLVSTTVSTMHQVLWPKLLEYFVKDDYILALPALCKSLNQVIMKLEEESKFSVPKLGQNKFPNREQLFVRLYVLAGCPLTSSDGIQERDLLLKLGNDVHENMAVVITGRDCNSPTLDDQSILHIVRDSRAALYLDILDSLAAKFEDSFMECLIEEMMLQGDEYKAHYFAQKGFITKCLGILSNRITSKSLLNKVLHYIFHDIKHGHYLYREDCSFAVSQASLNNFPAVKSVIEDLVKSCLSRKMPQFFNFMKDKKDDEEAVKVMVLEAIVDVLDRCLTQLPAEEVADCLEKSFVPVCNTVKAEHYYRDVLISVQRLASTYLRHQSDNILMGERLRLEFLFIAQKFIVGHVGHPKVQSYAIMASTELVKLNPPLEYITMSKYISCVLDFTLSYFNKDSKKPSDNDLEVMLTNCMDLLSAVLLHEVSPSVLDELMEFLYPWYSSPTRAQLAVFRISHNLFQKYFDNLHFSIETPNSFGRSGYHLGKLILYCTDPDPAIQHFTILSVYLILKILTRYEGYARDHEDPFLDSILTLLGDMNNSSSEPTVCIAELGKILAKKIPATQLREFLDVIFQCLPSVVDENSVNSVLIIQEILTEKTAELHNSTAHLIGVIHGVYGALTSGVREPLLNCIVILARQNINLVTDILLKAPLPHDDFVTSCWKRLRNEDTLFIHLIENFLDVLKTVGLYENQRDVRSSVQHYRIASLLPISAICSLSSLLQGEGNVNILNKEFSRILATLLAVQSCYLGVCAPASQPEASPVPGGKKPPSYNIVPNRDAYRLSPMQLASDCLKSFFDSCGCHATVNEMDKYLLKWPKLEDLDQYATIISNVILCLIDERPTMISKFIPEVTPYLNSIYEGQRVMSAAILTELMRRNCKGDTNLVDSLCMNLLSKIVDSSPIVRKLGFQGLGLTGQLLRSKVEKAESVFMAFINGIDDREDPYGMVTIHAMKGLSSLLPYLKEDLIKDNLSTIAYRVRPYFDKDNVELRQWSFQLLGDIAKFADKDDEEYVDHVVNSLPAFLVHLNDVDCHVSQACQSSLLNVASVLSHKLSGALKENLVKSSEVDREVFYPRIVKAMIEDMPTKLNLFISSFSGYCQSRWSQVQMSAALILSNFVSLSGPGDVDPNQIIMSMILLLREPDREVKLTSIKAINQLNFNA